jgi:hypothetical protein
MKFVTIVFFFFITGISVGQKMEFRVQSSEPLAVFEFVNQITESGGNNPYKDAFQSSKYYTDANKRLLEKFESINYMYWYEYPQYPYGNKIGGNTYFLLAKNLINSKSFEEFAKESIGIIPNSDLASMTEILTSFLPIYRELIFKPNEGLYRIQVSAIQKKILATDVSAYFNKVKRFHNSSWNNSTTFILILCPQPKTEKPGFSASAFFNYAISNIPVNETNYDLVLSVMFHEAFHIVYDEQALEFKKKIDNWFNENPSKTSRYAELLFNEAVTTALSSGFLYKELSKKELPKEKWYNNRYINDMAVAMYPMVNQYLSQNLQVDQAFIDAYIDIYEKQFSAWIFMVDNILADRFIVAENSADYEAISKQFRQRNIAEYERQLNSETLQKIKKYPITKLIVIVKNHQETANLIKKYFVELKDWAPDSKLDFAFSMFLDDKTYIIILNSVHKPAIDLLKDQKLK